MEKQRKKKKKNRISIYRWVNKSFDLRSPFNPWMRIRMILEKREKTRLFNLTIHQF